MQEAHIFKYSQVIKTDRIATITKFSEHSGLTIQNVTSIAYTQEVPTGIIYNYKIGKLTIEEFYEKMNELIEQADGKPITDNKIFDNAWNAMCKVEPETLTKLYDSQQKHNFHIHIIGGTNELQHNYIQDEIQKAPYKPDISYTLSHILGTLDNELLKNNAETALKPNYELVWHTDEQNEYEQNAMKILGDHYSEATI